MTQVPFDSEMYFMIFDQKWVFTIYDEKLVSRGSMNEEVRSWVKECFCVLEWCEKITFYYFNKFSHFTHFDEMKNLRNSIKPSQLLQISHNLLL